MNPTLLKEATVALLVAITVVVVAGTAVIVRLLRRKLTEG
jgi:hypothetical protein